MPTAYLWVTLLSPQVVDVLVAGLVRKGWSVGPLASSKTLQWGGPVSVLVSLKIEGVEPKDKTTTQAIVLEATKEVLKGYYYHSIIAQEYGGSSTWCGPNIELPKAETRKTALDRVAGENLLDDP